jgi:hypothetical protein
MSGRYEEMIKPVADKFDLASKIEGASISVTGAYAGSLATAIRAMARHIDRETLRDELARENRRLWRNLVLGVAVIFAIGAAGWWYRN